MFRLSLLFLSLALLFIQPAQAEQYKDFGAYRIHYNAFNSDLLAPEVAKAHGLSRSSYEAIVNITVQKKDGQGGFSPVRAKIKGDARDIYSSIKKLKMKEIVEGDVVYYLAELPITNEQKLTFNIHVLPKGEKVAHNLSFEQQFFVK